MVYAYLFFIVLFSFSFLRVESQCPCKVAFYWDGGYGGGTFSLAGGSKIDDLTTNGWNDQISSLRFFSSNPNCACVLTACWNTYCSGGNYGGSQDYIDDQAYVGDYANDQFSSLYVNTYNLTDPYVMFYKSCKGSPDYSWFATPTSGSGEVNGYRSIFDNDLSYNHIGNDALSRVVISPNAAVQLYWDNDFLGSVINFIGPADISCLVSTSSGNWNDQTSSAKLWDLSKSKSFPSPTGHWVLQTSAGTAQALSYQITYGYTTTDSTSSSTSFTLQITNSIEAGADFEVESVKTSMSIETSTTIASTIESSITKATTVQCTLTCAANTCPPNNVTYLFSWVMDFQRPWEDLPSTTLSSCNYICRCDSKSPRCPLTACADSTCSTCTPFQK